MELFDTTFEEAIRYPLFLRRLMQMHILPLPVTEGQMRAEQLALPTLDFGSRLEVVVLGDQTVISGDVSSARIVEGVNFKNLCPVSLSRVDPDGRRDLSAHATND
jgi:hypothetical protein